MAAIAGGAKATVVAFARVIAATTPTIPSTPIRSRPNGGRRASSTPAAPATAMSTRPMPMSSAALSAVPKSAIAASFAHGGARSMSSDPTVTKGLDAGASTAAASSPTPAPNATDATPATAGSTHPARRRGDSGMRTAYAGCLHVGSRHPDAAAHVGGPCQNLHP